MECKREKNLEHCICSESSCPNKGICCNCIRYHREHNQIPGCYFSKEEEATYDRSIENFIRYWQSKNA